MSFNSYSFCLFFAMVLLLYRRLGHQAQNRMLLVCSYFFYGCWDWRFLGLVAASTVIDYWVAILIEHTQSTYRRRSILAISIVANLGTLAFFKYYNFFSHEFQTLLEGLGFGVLLPRLDVILPVGISFYTFQTMSYTIDVYRRALPAQRNFLDFALYVAYFPQLVAGPIERASQLLPQLVNPRTPIPNGFAKGLYYILLGLFKKIFVADSMAVLANGVFATGAHELSGLEVLFGIYAFALQIYCDFSGYSLIAKGVSLWLDVELNDNFLNPYFSTSPSEFWQRWHISLSQWLRDYVYIPLGGNRYGTLRTYANLMTTMLLGGLWHGANWTFIAWGAYHGALLCLFRALSPKPSANASKPERTPSIAKHLLAVFGFFHLICFGWLLFRAESLEQVGHMLSVMAHPWAMTPLAQAMLGMLLFYGGPLMLFELWTGNKPSLRLLDSHWSVRAAVYAAAFHGMVFFAAPQSAQFIYFQF